ncbi:Uncharacterised protein [Chlamydia trachomatis]|nr:Uncharacterised protein [Chlamydia trachomatis]
MYGLHQFLKDGKKVVASTTNQIARLLRVLNENMSARYTRLENNFDPSKYIDESSYWEV